MRTSKYFTNYALTDFYFKILKINMFSYCELLKYILLKICDVMLITKTKLK